MEKNIHKPAVLILLLLALTLVITGQHVSQAKSTDNAAATLESTCDPVIQLFGSASPDFAHIREYITSMVRPRDAQPAKPAPVPTTTYIVKSGDTLWDIATACQTSVANLRALNNLSSDALSLGQKLIVSGQAKPDQANPSSTPNPSRGDSSRTGTILQTAARYLHTPYRWGGTSPKGFDCSGYVQYVFRQSGYTLPRTAAAQASVGARVERSSLTPGDLVFFAMHGSGIDHVGIYAGNGRFIHSSSPTSGGVIYSSLSESAYARSYTGARRVVR